jgi:glucose-6-phosphate isomerase
MADIFEITQEEKDRFLIKAEQLREAGIKSLFEKDQARSDRFKLVMEDIGLYFDYSKNLLDDEAMGLLLSLAEKADISKAAEDMFSGKRINITEKRAVLHTALRNRSGLPVLLDGKDVMPEILGELERIRIFSDEVREGRRTGYSGKKITDVVNVGIGGSDLGPKMVCSALRHLSDGPKSHFVSNVDASDIKNVLDGLDPEKVLFLVASKTFTTQETMTNAKTARKWLVDSLGEKAVPSHFAALSTNITKVTEFGIDKENMFVFWDFVGGRYSLWSAIGMSIALSIGFSRFTELLEGAHIADRHFLNNAYGENIPVIMALLGVWYNNFFGCQTHAVLPYSDNLSRLPAYLQQADMESNGKSVNSSGNRIKGQTGPVIWGEPGTNGQHSFYQLIHQGTKMVPSDFIGYIKAPDRLGDHHEKLMANFFAQTEALAFGLDEEKVRQNLIREGLSGDEIDNLVPFRTFAGNRPSSTFLFDELNPRSLGALIAFYEHKIFTQGIMWGINSFDQWGVELGKKMAGVILGEISDQEIRDTHDSSTKALLERFLTVKGNTHTI